MFGPKLNTVFKSRWNALLWSACVLATAYCSIPSPEKTRADQAQRAAQAAAAHPKNPWAK